MTQLTTYVTQNVVRLSAVFTDDDEAAMDPTDVYLTIQGPDLVETTYHYGVDVDLVKDSKGHYHYDKSLPDAGVYQYYWHSTGTGTASARGSLIVQHAEV